MTGYILDSIKESIRSEIAKMLELPLEDITVDRPSNPQYGDLGTSVCFKFAKKIAKDKKEQRALAVKKAEILRDMLKKVPLKYIAEIEAVNGFVNFRLDYPSFIKDVLAQIIQMGSDYGRQDVGKGKVIVVEHTSANPIHPLHIGTARNSVLGDNLQRIFGMLGYKVIRAFYVDDMGKQVAYLVYGYNKIKRNLAPVGKKDHWFGILYASTVSTIEMLKRLEKLLNIKNAVLATTSNDPEKQPIVKLLRDYVACNWIEALKQVSREAISAEKEMNEWLESLMGLLVRAHELTGVLISEIMKENVNDIEAEVSFLVKRYEEQDKKVVKDFREVVESVLEGFRETLNRVGISFDSFDWESDLVFSGLVDKVIQKLEKWTFVKDGALYLNIHEAIRKFTEIQEIFGIDKDKLQGILRKGKYEELPPNLVLRRSDGTTLYSTRDIAYSIYKFEKFQATRVYNVIGKDQTLAQQQVRTALYLAGYENYAKNLIHVAYEMVLLKGGKLSSRRGRYITFDEVIEEAKRIAILELKKRYPDLPLEEIDVRAEKIAIGAIRYALSSVAPEKVLEFDWSKVLDFERNSGPFLQYTYARMCSILRKAGDDLINNVLERMEQINYSLLSQKIEKDLVMLLSQFPEVIRSAAKELKPNVLIDYVNRLAITFNSFYQQFPVLKARTSELRDARLVLVMATEVVLRNALRLIGIPLLERM